MQAALGQSGVRFISDNDGNYDGINDAEDDPDDDVEEMDDDEKSSWAKEIIPITILAFTLNIMFVILLLWKRRLVLLKTV